MRTRGRALNVPTAALVKLMQIDEQAIHRCTEVCRLLRNSLVQAVPITTNLWMASGRAAYNPDLMCRVFIRRVSSIFGFQLSSPSYIKYDLPRSPVRALGLWAAGGGL